MSRRLRRRASRGGLNDVPLTPLIDTALTLLIIFMVATPMVHHAIRVDLPHGQAQEQPQQKQEIVVHVDREQKLYLNGELISMENLITALREYAQQDEQAVVFVKADRAVSYGCVVELVDRMKEGSGVRRVALATQAGGAAQKTGSAI